jgi:hypothetical protein
MIRVYEASSAIDAHLLRGLLEQRGIPVHIVGEHLLGAMGDLPAHGLVGVLVPEAHAAEARAVAHLFETGEDLDPEAFAGESARAVIDPAESPDSEPAPAWWQREDDVDWLAALLGLGLLASAHLLRAAPL